MAISWRGVYTNTAMAVIPERSYFGMAFILTQPWLDVREKVLKRFKLSRVGGWSYFGVSFFWDASTWPLGKIVQDNNHYAKAVKLMAYRTNSAKLDFYELSLMRVDSLLSCLQLLTYASEGAGTIEWSDLAIRDVRSSDTYVMLTLETRYKEKYRINPALRICKIPYEDPEREKFRNRFPLKTLLKQNPHSY
ncbi:hypothetical protein Tco_0401003 [Tanacetum coccineum]